MNEKIDFQDTSIDSNKKLIYKISIGILVVIFFSTIAIFTIISENRKTGWTFVSNESTLSQNFEISDSNEAFNNLYPVYITGEINNPGIYHIIMPAYLFELIEMAGGLTENAAAEFIDLVYKINESITIKIPSSDEISQIEYNHFAENIIINESFKNRDSPVNSGLVNINTAGKSLLESLPGIGPSTAQQIIFYRDNYGKFKKIEDIMNVTGIKENKFNQIKDMISVN